MGWHDKGEREKEKGKRIEETGKRVEWIIKLNGLIAPVKFAVLISSKYLTGYRLNKLIGLI